MKIYFAHATTFDFKTEYYTPMKTSSLAVNNELIFPHDTSQFTNSRSIIEACGLVVAEVSYPSTGLGIELGWASAASKPIVAVHRSGAEVAKSIRAVTDQFIAYSSADDLTQKLERYAQSLN